MIASLQRREHCHGITQLLWQMHDNNKENTLFVYKRGHKGDRGLVHFCIGCHICLGFFGKIMHADEECWNLEACKQIEMKERLSQQTSDTTPAER